MALSAKQLAGEAAYQLYNVADHVSRGAQDAQRAIESGDFARARECLQNVARSAELFEMRFRDAVDYAARAEVGF